MAQKKKPDQVIFTVAHETPSSSQFGDAVFHPSGRYVLSAGADKAIAGWSHTDRKQLFRVSTAHREDITCIAISVQGDKLVTGSADHAVHLYVNKGSAETSDWQFDQIVTRFEMPVRSVCFSSDASKVAAGSDDGHIKIVSLSDMTLIRELNVHEGGIKCVTFDPQGLWIASSACDGLLKVNSIEEEAKEICSVPNLFPAKMQPGDMNLCKLMWHPSGKYLAVSSLNEVKVLDRETWISVASLRREHTKPVSVVSYSMNGRYLATAGQDELVIVWDMSTREILHKYKHLQTTVAVTWSPTTNALCMLDASGKIGTWSEPVPSKLSPPFGPLPDDVPIAKTLQKMMETDPDMFDTSDSELVPPVASSVTLIERQPTTTLSSTVTDTTTTTKSTNEDKNEAQSDTAANEPPAEVDSAAENSTSAHSYKDLFKSRLLEDREPIIQTAVTSTAQPAFQPGSTPFRLKKKFYMCFNRLGKIIARDDHLQVNIDIEFHDMTLHKPVKLVERNSVVLGSLGGKGAAFASKANIVDNVPSSLIYHPIESFGGSTAKWNVQLPMDEEAEGLAVTSSWVVLATSKRYLRIFTASGVQYHMLSIPGPFVALNAHDDLVVVAYHSGSGFDGDQQLSFMQLDLFTCTVTAQGPIALSSASTLTWIGFSSNVLLSTCDSDGVVRMLLGDWKQWTPVAETPKGKLGKMWVFGVTDRAVNCIPLKEEDDYPLAFPAPVPTTVPLKIPFLHGERESTSLEEQYVRERMFLQHQINATPDIVEHMDTRRARAMLDTYLIQLVELALRGDKPERVISLAQMLQFEKSLLMSIEMCSAAKFSRVAELLQQHWTERYHKEEEEAEEAEQEQEEEEQQQAGQQNDSQDAMEEEEEEVKIVERPSPSKKEPKQAVRPKTEYSNSLPSLETQKLYDSNDEDEAQETKPPKKRALANSADKVAKSNGNGNTANGNANVKVKRQAETEETGQRKRNKFATAGPSKSASGSDLNLFGELNKLQEASDKPTAKAKAPTKLQSYFKK